jgi:hypothetical protein
LAGGPAGSPRVDVVFRLWQCDKDNHGWREGPPLTVLWQSVDLLPGLHPPAKSISNEKRILHSVGCREPLIQTLAGIKGVLGDHRRQAHWKCRGENVLASKGVGGHARSGHAGACLLFPSTQPLRLANGHNVAHDPRQPSGVRRRRGRYGEHLRHVIPAGQALSASATACAPVRSGKPISSLSMRP